MKLDEYRFLIFGPSTFDSLPHRGQGIAFELARRGVHVDYIEIAPSMVGLMRQRMNTLFSPSSIEFKDNKDQYPDGLHVHEPPRVPTSFRNSLTPALDRNRFLKWFHVQFADYPWEKTVVWIMLPLWWKWFIDESIIKPRLLVYDIADDLSVFSTSRYSLSRLAEGERLLTKELDMVTYSAGEMKQDIARRFPGLASFFLPNAMAEQFQELATLPLKENGKKHTIGFVGAISDKWVDKGLIVKVIEAFESCDITIVGPMDSKFAETLRGYSNVNVTGFLRHNEIIDVLQQFSVGLIPFKQNEITRVVNPLKLYEYSAAGLPIVSMLTDELKHYERYVYLSDSHESFITNIGKALDEANPAATLMRKKFALENTWQSRITDLQDALQPVLI